MAMIRLQHRIPEVYTNQSRDFQLISRIYDLLVNGVIFDAESIVDAANTSNCNNVLLQLLQSKVGFFSNSQITDEDLRIIVEAFPYLIKNKGSLAAIKQAINIFLKINNIKTESYISVVNKNNNTQFDDYSVNIGIASDVKNTNILTEIFNYILPTGYKINYFFYTSSATITVYKFNDDSISYVYSSENVGSQVTADNDPGDIFYQLATAIKDYQYYQSEYKTILHKYYNPSDSQFYNEYDESTKIFLDKYIPTSISSESKTCYIDILTHTCYQCVQAGESSKYEILTCVATVCGIVEGYYDAENTKQFYANYDKTTKTFSDLIIPILPGSAENSSIGLCYHDNIGHMDYSIGKVITDYYMCYQTAPEIKYQKLFEVL